MSTPTLDAAGLAALIQEIDGLASQLLAARGIVDSGELVDLQGLDGEVDRLCRAAQVLSREQGRQASPALKRLTGALDVLTAAVAAQRQAVAASLRNVSARKQAVSAYGRVPSKPRR
jgi:ABC-type transporter Mla subunit MlaD